MFLLRILFRLYNLYLSPDKALARRVLNMTGFVPARLSVFKLAFSHKSSQVGREPGQTNNERLEYLGDAVLGTVVADYLFKKYPNADEGFLTKMRSKIVKRKSLNYIGDQMGLNLLLSEYNRTRLSSSMLGNAVEALVGAVYLEKGYAPTKRFVVQRILKLYVDVHELETVDDNFKSQLLEACQREGKTVGYQLVSKYKQDRRDRFQVAVVINGEQVATADDYNKKAAEQLASLKALQKLNLIEPGTLPTGAHLATPDTEPQRVNRKSKEERSPRGESASRKPARERAEVTEPSVERSRGVDPADAPAFGKRRGSDTSSGAGADEVSRPYTPAKPADEAEVGTRTPRPPKISFAEATALVAAERAGSTDRTRATDAAIPHAADLGTSAGSFAERPDSLSDDDRTDRKSASRRREKQRSPTAYLNRHAVRGATAVAHLLDGFDFAAGSFAPHAPTVLAEAPHARTAPETSQPTTEESMDRLSPKPLSVGMSDAQESHSTDAGASVVEALPKKPRSSRRKGPRSAGPEHPATPDIATEASRETEAEKLKASSETSAPPSTRRRANRPQPPLPKHVMRKIVADAGAGLVAARNPEEDRNEILVPRPPKPARKRTGEPQQVVEDATDAGQVSPTFPEIATHVGIEFVVTEKPKSRSRRKPAVPADLEHVARGDSLAEVELDLTQPTGAIPASAREAHSERNTPVIDLTGFVHVEEEATTLPNGSTVDATPDLAERASPTPDRKVKSSRNRRRRASSAEEEEEEESRPSESEALSDALPEVESDLPDGDDSLSWEDTLLELSFPEFVLGNAADDARLTDSRNPD